MNIPNTLTALRLFMVPVFVFFYLKGCDGSMPYGVILAAITFILAALTDMLDGFLARKLGQITDFGKLADPLADKMMQVAAIGCLAYNGRFSLWIFYVYLAKEILLIFGGAKLLKFQKFVVYSKWSGKIATVLLFIMIVVIMVFEEIPKATATKMMILCILFTMVALFNYIQMYVKVKENHKLKKSLGEE